MFRTSKPGVVTIQIGELANTVGNLLFDLRVSSEIDFEDRSFYHKDYSESAGVARVYLSDLESEGVIETDNQTESIEQDLSNDLTTWNGKTEVINRDHGQQTR